jgi:hypothetical protein
VNFLFLVEVKDKSGEWRAAILDNQGTYHTEFTSAKKELDALKLRVPKAKIRISTFERLGVKEKAAPVPKKRRVHLDKEGFLVCHY